MLSFTSFFQILIIIRLLFNKCNTITEEFEQHLYNLRIEIDDILELSEKSIDYTVKTISEVKTKVFEHGFSNTDEEIFFFKSVKPKFVSRLIYHIKVYQIETHRPNGSIKIKRKFLQKELSKLKYYFDYNLEFYRYHRTGATYLDHKYFVRGQYDIRLNIDAQCYETDSAFSTNHDYKVSTILAYDLLEVYLEKQLTQLEYQPVSRDTKLVPRNVLRWTGSKIALTELMYALFATRSFNNGNTDIKTLAAYVEKIFDVELGDYYHTYLKLRHRNNPTKFMDTLKETLSNKMEDDDEK